MKFKAGTAALGAILAILPCSAASQASTTRSTELPPPLAALEKSYFHLETGWKFKTDPTDKGEIRGWMKPGFDVGSWENIRTGYSWEEQGHPGYSGIAWYRLNFNIPAEWQGSKVKLEFQGVTDEVEVFIDGQSVAHLCGEGESCAGADLQLEIQDFLHYGRSNTFALKVTSPGPHGGITSDLRLKRVLDFEPFKKLIPEPVLDDHSDWIDLYWKAWQLAWEKIALKNSRNGFVDAYMDEGFNEQIYQWDTSFMAMFGRYGRELFPAMPSLDNFYRKQKPDGYIQRVYSETSGEEWQTPTPEEPVVNPPLFAWVEWEYYRLSGDSSRLARVFPVLEKYYLWIQSHMRTPQGKGLYFETPWGSGMDNTPRGNSAGVAWIDISAQQALAAGHLAKIAGVLGLTDRSKFWQNEHDSLSQLINRTLWSRNAGFYSDLNADGSLTDVKHIGAYWTMLAGVAPADRAHELVRKLKDPKEFGRPHLFPSLSASDPEYSPTGTYWRGGIWAPTNYMVIQSLKRYGEYDFAREASINYISEMSDVFHSPELNPDQFWFSERDRDHHTIWECYSPEAELPSTRWDGQFYCMQDFVGWSGLGPIALLIEDVLGFEIVGSENKVIWRLEEQGRAGIRNILVTNDNHADLIADAADARGDRKLHLKAEKPFQLELHTSAGTQTIPVSGHPESVVIRGNH